MTVPDELDGWIVVVGAVDPSSDYLRYPVTKNENADKAKSSFKEVALDSLFPSEPSKEKVHAMTKMEMLSVLSSTITRLTAKPKMLR